MALIAAHLNAGVILVVTSVAIETERQTLNAGVILAVTSVAIEIERQRD